MNEEAVRTGIAAHVSNERIPIFRATLFMEYPEDGDTNPNRNTVNYTQVCMES